MAHPLSKELGFMQIFASWLYKWTSKEANIRRLKKVNVDATLFTVVSYWCYW